MTSAEPNLPAFGLLLGADGLTVRRSGVGRVILEAARLLRADPAVAELRLLIGAAAEPPDLVDRLDAIPPAPDRGLSPLRVALSAVPGLARLRSLGLRRRLDRVAADMAVRTGRPVLYHEMNTIARPFSGPTVVTVHDLSFRADPALHPPARVAWMERRLPATLRQASRFAAVSAFTKAEMVARLGIAPDRIDVVEPGLAAEFRPTEEAAAAPVLARFGLADRAYVLAVSTLEPRKNFDRLLAAHLRLPAPLRARFPLVIAGGRGWGNVLEGADAERAIAAGTLRLPGFLPDADLIALYGRAAACAYPSLYEGFGLPALEAMACDTPLVTSATSALAGTAGDAALKVDPFDTAALSSALRQVLEDEALAADLRARGLIHASRYTWTRMTQGLIACWRRALS
ncbi:MAG: glycosyltransferase family 4 protein [Proteobacteria bacterium]|nr:glycosyltransferase family 4 protein [Pseudomonadota bacterium]